jgi:hypothetical protein
MLTKDNLPLLILAIALSLLVVFSALTNYGAPH